MPSSKDHAAWTVSPHAKQRAWERYGIIFSPKKWTEFCETLQKGKRSIRLETGESGSCRFACYFQETWFLVGCSIHGDGGTVSTFLPADALADGDKIILQSDDRYRRFGNDEWNIMHQRLSGTIMAKERKPLPI